MKLPVVMVRTKDQCWGMCIDYSRFNAITKRYAYTLPRIDDSLDTLS